MDDFFDGVESAVGFQSDVLTQLNEHLLVFHLWVGYLLNTSDEKKLRTQIKWFMFLSWHTSTIRRWIAQDDEQIGPLRY